MKTVSKVCASTLLIIGLVACGGGSESPEKETSYRITIPGAEKLGIKTDDINIVIEVNGNKCIIGENLQADCGTLLDQTYSYTLTYTHTPSNKVFASGSGDFTIAEGKHTPVDPTYIETQELVDWINAEFEKTNVSFKLPYPAGTENFNEKMDTIITVNGNTCVPDWENLVVNCSSVTKFGISKSDRKITYDIKFTETGNSENILGQINGSFDVIVGQENSIDINSGLASNITDDTDAKNNLDKFVASFGSNWDQMYWDRGTWAE